MIKSNLMTRLASKHPEINEVQFSKIVNLIFEQMTDALVANERIEIRGFGSFSLHYRAARKAHNPKTGEKVVSKPKYSPHFKPGKELKEKVTA